MDKYPKIIFAHYRVLKYPYMPRKGAPDENHMIPRHRVEIHGSNAVSPRGGKTICRIDFGGGRHSVGIATCSMSDNFCHATGRVLALARAMELLDPVTKIAVAGVIGGKNAQPESV